MQDGAIGGGGGDIHMLMSILADGEEQARQLGEAAAAATADESSYYRGMARQLQCTFASAMAVARTIDSAAATTTTTGDRSDSPRSADESSARTARDGGVVAAQQERQDMSKRRKGLPRWTEKFRVPDANLEATPDDGFSWRKYGQKDILGAKFPRGYYRCTYRNAQGCPATKQVQRSDADLAVFDVTYHGAHTCHQKQRHVTTTAAGKNSPPPPPPEADPSAELLVNNFKHGLKVETNNGLAPPPAANFDDQQFCFPSVQPFHDDAGGGGFTSPAFVSPAGSSAAGGSSYFSVDHCYGGEPLGQFVMSRGDSSELHEVVSAATSTEAAAVVDPSAAAVTVATAGGGFVVDYPLSYLQHAGGELIDDPHLPFPPLFGPASMYGQYRDA
uniref:WRKY domain-containing protein n=1 Tax=Leersia perrieri TaxID=77586 RepID=A0A0D9WM54_9ORYZ